MCFRVKIWVNLFKLRGLEARPIKFTGEVCSEVTRAVIFCVPN